MYILLCSCTHSSSYTLWLTSIQSALFNFQSALMVLLLLICTSAYCHQLFPAYMDRKKDSYVDTIMGRGLGPIFWKCARIGERLSPYISVCCIIFAVCCLIPDLGLQKLIKTGPIVHWRIRHSFEQAFRVSEFYTTLHKAKSEE
jgi:hypothetical protein